jgi:hypothetical protein
MLIEYQLQVEIKIIKFLWIVGLVLVLVLSFIIGVLLPVHLLLEVSINHMIIFFLLFRSSLSLMSVKLRKVLYDPSSF